MLTSLRFSFWNLVYFRVARLIDRSHLNRLESKCESIEDTRLALTNACLATVGLKAVDCDTDKIPWHVALSPLQRSWVKTVQGHGYKVGLDVD